MSDLQARKEELQGFIDLRKKQLEEGVSLSAKGVIESEITAFEAEIAAIDTQAEQEAAQQVRIQAQEEKVATIVLPYDFNALYNDTTANDSIIEVVQIFLRAANDETNKEVQALNDSITELKKENAQLILEKQDAESKRDAAMTKVDGIELLLSEKQAQIETLRAEAAIGASKAINVTNISPSDRLAQLVEISKNAKIKSAAEIALENTVPFRGNVAVASPVALEVPNFPVQADISANPVDQTQPGTIPTTDPVTAEQFRNSVASVQASEAVSQANPGDGTVSGNAESVPTATVTRNEFEALIGRVEYIEKQAGIRVA